MCVCVCVCVAVHIYIHNNYMFLHASLVTRPSLTAIFAAVKKKCVYFFFFSTDAKKAVREGLDYYSHAVWLYVCIQGSPSLEPRTYTPRYYQGCEIQSGRVRPGFEAKATLP